MDAVPFEYITYSISTSPPSYLLNFIYAGNDSTWDYDKCCRLQLCMIPTSDKNYALRKGTATLSTASDSTFEFAAECIQRCEKTHVKCSQNAPSQRPTCSPVSYATLSHRWGTATLFQLTSKNIDSLQQRIRLDLLSQTFRDAFIAARRLGVRYMWIDSLCIVQDDIGDWQKEAARMGDVYATAKFNISATGARASDNGLFVDRDLLAIDPCTIAIDPSEDSKAWRSDSYHLLNPSLWASNISDAPLNKRGWVYTPMRCTSTRCTPMRCTSMGYTPMTCTPSEMHAHEVHASEMHAHEARL